MPDPSIHHAERIERECAEHRLDARSKVGAELRRTIDYWTDIAPTRGTTRQNEAYCAEHARLHTIMLAALVADGEVS